MASPFFFILGRPRSGTTLLKSLFDAHPNVRIPPELPIFLPLYQKFRHVKMWDREQKLRFVDHVFHPNVFNNRKLENLKINREEFTARLLGQPEDITIRDLLVLFNEAAWSAFPKEEILLVGDKNPVYSIFTRRFLKIFPDAKFICIIRDYRDNFVSLRNLEEVKLEAPVLSLQIIRWRYISKLFLRCRKEFPGQFFVIRYEDLVTRPEESFSEICRFLDLPYLKGVFEFYRKKDEILQAFPNPMIAKIHKSLMEPVNTGRMDLWKKQMTAQEVRMADFIAGRTADELGYARQYRGFSMILFLRSVPMAVYNRILFFMMQTASRLPYGPSRWFARQVLRLARIYGRFSGGKNKEAQAK